MIYAKGVGEFSWGMPRSDVHFDPGGTVETGGQGAVAGGRGTHQKRGQGLVRQGSGERGQGLEDILNPDSVAPMGPVVE